MRPVAARAAKKNGKKRRAWNDLRMTATEHVEQDCPSVDEVQKGWNDLSLRVKQLEAERAALDLENKSLRFLVERVIEHRQKSHAELILLLTGLVTKLPINDVGLVVSRLVEHNRHLSEVCAALAKGKADSDLPTPMVLKALEETKRDLAAALKPVIEELIHLDTPLETEMLRSLIADPQLIYSPAVIRANRCFVKGQVPRERAVKEFGEEALVFFNDMTTDAKLNPRPKPEEIVLAFKPDFETLFQQNPTLAASKRNELMALYQRVQRSKAPTEEARQQRNAFQRMSFILEMMHYYEHQSTEPPDVVFAQRLPALVEQLVISGPNDALEEKPIAQVEVLLAFIINPDHRLMVVNNMGKPGGSARTLRYLLRLRAEHVPDHDEVVHDFLKHLIPSAPQRPPPPQSLTPILRLLKPDRQKAVVRHILSLERIKRDDADALGRAVAKELGLTGIEAEVRAQAAVSPEVERQIAWRTIRELITQRADPSAIAAAFRQRLHAKYDSDEIKQSWLTLIDADPMSLIRTFCQLPYLPDGRTDPIARTIMETYITRLTHEKYTATYIKVVNSLRNMYRAKPDSPTLVNFLALVRWVDPVSADRLSQDIGMAAAA
jgi:hypothetical protein